MNDLLQRIANIDWQAVTEILAEKGYTVVSQFLPIQNCNELIAEYDGKVSFWIRRIQIFQISFA
jgi:hypothetical protein